MKVCSMPGCGKRVVARGYCSRHYNIWKRHGSADAVIRQLAPAGAPLAFLKSYLGTDETDCIEWPFCRHPDGYGKLQFRGKTAYANRVMCTLAHGEPPSNDHEAAHSCGNRPCINQNHLRWATRADNHADMVAHGTMPLGEGHANSKLTEQAVIAIRRSGAPCSALAAEHGVSPTNISVIRRGITWAWLDAQQERSMP